MMRMLLLLGLLVSMSSVHAKDVSAQQAGAEYAREALLKAESEHQDNLKKVAESEKDLLEAQKQLAEDRKRAEASKGRLDQAKARSDRAQALLEQAWKQ